MQKNLDELIQRSSDPSRWDRIPGLFRRWELEQIFEAGFEYRIEEWGLDATGCDLVALYRRKPPEDPE